MAEETSRNYDMTRQYFQGIQRLPQKSREELHELWKRAKKGDGQAKKIIMESNLKLVIPIAKKYHRANMDFLDLVEEGNLGLMHAIDKFKPEKGFRFSTYASYWIEQAIRRAIEEQSKTIRIPPHAWEALRKWFKTWDKLHGQLGHDPTVAQMSQKTGLTARQIKGIIQAAEAAKEMGSLESSVGDEENLSLEEIIRDTQEVSPEKVLNEIKTKDEIRQALDTLNVREKKVLTLRYGLNKEDGKTHTLEEVGDILKLSRERVRQIETRALERLNRMAHRIGLVENASLAGQVRRSEKTKNVMRLSKGILWSKQHQPLGKKLKFR